MASVNTIDLTAKVFSDFVTGLPPKPNHFIPKFHNRSNLFPSTFTNKVYEQENNQPNRQAWSADPRLRQPTAREPTEHKDLHKESKKTSFTSSKNSLKRRPCSAKARLETSKLTKPHEHNAVSNEAQLQNSCTMLVPVGGKEVPIVDIGGAAPFPSYHYLFTTKEKFVSDDTKPFVSGITDNRIPSLNLYHTPETTKTDASPSIKPLVHGLNSHQVLYGTDFVGEPCDIKYDLPPPAVEKPERCLPSTLEPLRPWLTEGKIIPGISPTDCLIFLPTMSDYNDLPEVPPPHSVHEDLPYTSKLQQPITTKKYHHPSFDKKHVEDWVCHHSRPGTAYSTDYQSFYPKYRNPNDIREEILELENLMQGLGNIDSDCGMVKFQGEIDRFRQMYKDTMKMIPERLLHSPKDPDTFGVKEFLRQHVDIMNEIRRKHTLCLEELLILEAESGIDSSRKYFKYRTGPPDT